MRRSRGWKLVVIHEKKKNEGRSYKDNIKMSKE